MSPSLPPSPGGPSRSNGRRSPQDLAQDPALDQLRGLWAAVQPPELPAEDLVDADSTTRAAVDWVRFALASSAAPCPAPADRRLPPRRPRLSWGRPAVAAAALLLALALALQPSADDASESPGAEVARADAPETERPPNGNQSTVKSQPSTMDVSTTDALPPSSALPRGLAARPSDTGLELRSGPVRLTFVTSPKTL